MLRPCYTKPSNDSSNITNRDNTCPREYESSKDTIQNLETRLIQLSAYGKEAVRKMDKAEVEVQQA